MVMVHMAYFFGWRTGTISALRCGDVSMFDAHGMVHLIVDERVAKGAQTRSAHLFRRLEVSASTAPGLISGL